MKKVIKIHKKYLIYISKFDNLSDEEFYMALQNNREQLKKYQQVEIIDNYIDEYSYYFNFDGDKVKVLMRKITNNFTEDYPLTIGKTEYTIDNPEAYAMLLVYYIEMYSKRLGVSKQDYLVSNEVINLEYDNNKIMMRDGNTFEAFLGHIADVLGTDKKFVLSISDAETGGRKNRQSRVQNNFGGLRTSNGFITFASPEAGVIAQVATIERLLSNYNYSSLAEFSGTYVNGNKDVPAPEWVLNVTKYYRKYTENEDEVFNYKYTSSDVKLAKFY